MFCNSLWCFGFCVSSFLLACLLFMLFCIFFQYHYFGNCFNSDIGFIDWVCRDSMGRFNGLMFAIHLSCFITFTICAIGIIIKIAEIFDYFNAYQNLRNYFRNFLKHLLQNGRKSLATVRDVQYRANSEEQYPEFVLRYAFNPPDDSAPDDLIHEVVVPYDPALKPEDVLPILYTVSEDSTEVMSMPFPFPTKALPELSSCYCKTSNGVIQSS